MSPPHHFSLRAASLTESDSSFIISAFDASLPYLETIGSLAQWGSTPFSQRPGWVEETQQQLQEPKRNHIADMTNSLRVFVLEAELVEQGIGRKDMEGLHSRVDDDGRRFVLVGFAFVRGNWFPGYLPAVTVAQAWPLQVEDCLYIEVMVSDARTKDLFRGVGAALIQEVRDYGRARGKKILYLDGWAGNERKLVRYYERQGFHEVAGFSLPRSQKEPWVGSLMRLTI
ncbi:hypothetical protein CC86DRAFT_407537 [Ophiobolus disseminans]|uniref:N-acetyltransferase domain-containing protein n=1 Tax=Ophiobolus disseminans TaxID=1469910 RepID=A0A6A6ZXP6_9PLEO|nr:hypothetical protein CC86DRAFT_407537 [Ophiobolus disseminans]